jgi:hypothetical protein
MYRSLLNRSMAAVVSCGLLLQGCKSGIHAITGEPVARQEYPTAEDHVQKPGEASSSGTFALASDAYIGDILGSTSPAEPALAVVPTLSLNPIPETLSRAVVNSFSQSFARPLIASPLPMPPKPCVYAGNLGLLERNPVQQAQLPEEEWRLGPTMILHGNAKSKEVYHIPLGYRYKSYRLKPGSVIQRARLTLHYIAAHDEEAYHRIEAAQNAHTVAEKLDTSVGRAVTLDTLNALDDTLEGGTSRSSFAGSEGHALQYTRYAGLVLCGSTKRDKPFREESKIDIQVEILLEKVDGGAPLSEVSSYISRERGRKKSSTLVEEGESSRRVVHNKRLLLQQKKNKGAQKRPELALKGKPAHLAGIRRKVEHRLQVQLDPLWQQYVVPPQVPPAATTIPSQAFGAKEWRRYLGEVDAEPPLPSDIDQILNSRCPFWPEAMVKDTHLLVLIPSRVADRPFTLNLLEELIKNPEGSGNSTEYRYYHDGVQRVLGDQSPKGSYWALMTRDVLEGSRDKEYLDQKALVAARARETGLPYELPGALEAATVILSHYVRDGERLYTDVPWTWTRCQELIVRVGGDCPVAVGGFSSRGFGVDTDNHVNSSRGYRGVSGLRRF